MIPIAFVFVLFLGISQATDLAQCQQSLESFKAKLESYSHYIPPPEDPMKKGGMDMDMDMNDMYKKKREDSNGQASNSDTDLTVMNCFFFNTTTNMVYINCASYQCIEILDNLVREYQTAFVEECPMAQGFEVDAQTELIVDSIRKFPGCNRCVVAYHQFLKLVDQAKNEGCWPTDDSYSCKSSCLTLNAEIKKRYETMFNNKLCRMRNPGGCSGDGGLTEGQIYDILKDMNNDITRIITASFLCNGNCASKTSEWYQAWKVTSQKGCLETDGVDLATQDPTMRIFKVVKQCNQDCRTQIDDLIFESFQVPSMCMGGLQAEHLSELVNAVNPKFCETESDISDLMDYPTARTAILGVIGFLGALVLVLVCVITVNAIKGRRGWDLLKIRKTPSYKKLSSEDRDDSMTIATDENQI